ncbi:MAG TPA: hypothetical protein PKV71_03200 [Calditrichia bacterium]|nr:hypothetical protein [Calditrichia bacterium]HQV30851.1 hypothetical protein [Calditrichia bacterium]
MKNILLLFGLASPFLFGQTFNVLEGPELFAPGIVSVASSEVKITFSRDGNLVIWGTVGRENGPGGLDIWQASRSDSGWGDPLPVSFNSPENDFDPGFSADGKHLYFFSNRPGGYGGDDLYVVSFDPESGDFGEPVNLGARINTAGDEWGPTESYDGQMLMFCSDSLGGKGEHDIFVCEKEGEDWGAPEAIAAVNSPLDDFDPIFLADNRTLLFTRKKNEDEAYLFISYFTEKGYSAPEQLSAVLNQSGTWNFGASPDRKDPAVFYYSTRIAEQSRGRLDIFRVKYSMDSGGNSGF